MSSAMDLLTSVSDYDSKPYLGFSQLAHGNHEIVCFRFVKNNFYKTVPGKPGLKRTLLVELKDQVLFLPEYFAVKFDDDDDKVEALNSDGIKKFLYFGGNRPNK